MIALVTPRRVALLLLFCLAAPAPAKRSRRVRTGTVVVQSTTLGAEVHIDGQQVATIPMEFPLALRAGKHTIKVSRLGYADYLDTFRTRAGKDTVLEIDLLPVSGVLKVAARPPGVVVVDGRQIGESPFLGEIEPGERRVEVRAAGHSVHRQTLQVEAGQQYPLEVQLVPLPPERPAEPTPWYGHWWVWAGAAAVVAGVVTVAAVAASGDDPPPEPDHLLTIEPQR